MFFAVRGSPRKVLKMKSCSIPEALMNFLHSFNSLVQFCTENHLAWPITPDCFARGYKCHLPQLLIDQLHSSAGQPVCHFFSHSSVVCTRSAYFGVCRSFLLSLSEWMVGIHRRSWMYRWFLCCWVLLQIVQAWFQFLSPVASSQTLQWCANDWPISGIGTVHQKFCQSMRHHTSLVWEPAKTSKSGRKTPSKIWCCPISVHIDSSVWSGCSLHLHCSCLSPQADAGNSWKMKVPWPLVWSSELLIWFAEFFSSAPSVPLQADWEQHTFHLPCSRANQQRLSTAHQLSSLHLTESAQQRLHFVQHSWHKQDQSYVLIGRWYWTRFGAFSVTTFSWTVVPFPHSLLSLFLLCFVCLLYCCVIFCCWNINMDLSHVAP